MSCGRIACRLVLTLGVEPERAVLPGSALRSGGSARSARRSSRSAGGERRGGGGRRGPLSRPGAGRQRTLRGKTQPVSHATDNSLTAHLTRKHRSIRAASATALPLTRAPLGGGLFRAPPPSGFLAISSKPMQVSPPNLQYPLSQQFYTLC